MPAAPHGLTEASARELAARRAAVVAAVRAVAPLELVNGGGTGSVERTAAEAAVTEVAAGSGLLGPAAAGLAIGDRVWLRHAKAGELCERLASLHLVSGDRVVDEVPTYRGEGRAFL